MARTQESTDRTDLLKALANAEAREIALRDILDVIHRSRDNQQPVFQIILEKAARLCEAPHAALLLANDDKTHLHVVAQNFAASKFLDTLHADPTPLVDNDHSLTLKALNTGQSQHCADIRTLLGTRHETTQLGYAIDIEGIRTVLIVPLRNGDEPLGVVFLYKHDIAPFADDEIRLVETFAAQAMIAIENVRQFKALEALNTELGDRVAAQVRQIARMGKLRRFLPTAVADKIISSNTEDVLSSHRALLSVMFCDMRGFTAFCETAEPEETIVVLQTYYEEMGRLINASHAGVDHRMGDGIMVLFNDPVPCDDPAGEAVRLAVAMRARMTELCRSWRRLGHQLGFGVGVSLGYATIGLVGFEERYDYTASGTAVNLAARLCAEAADGEILLSTRAGMAVEGDFAIESRGKISFKGIHEPLEVFRLADGATV